MSTRNWIVGVAIVMCAAALWATHAQHQRLVGLQAEQVELLARLDHASESTAPEETRAVPAHHAESSTDSELLRLRNEVTRLTDQRRALASARAENERLRAQAAGRATNRVSQAGLPQNFLRKTEARMVGFNSPEDTVQSVLWALQNRDLATFQQALTPEMAQKLQEEFQRTGSRSSDRLFQEAEKVLGLGITDVRATENGMMEAQMQMVSTNLDAGSSPDRVRFQQINGQWKIAGPF